VATCGTISGRNLSSSIVASLSIVCAAKALIASPHSAGEIKVKLGPALIYQRQDPTPIDDVKGRPLPCSRLAAGIRN
jgi:hypothetical protein